MNLVRQKFRQRFFRQKFFVKTAIIRQKRRLSSKIRKIKYFIYVCPKTMLPVKVEFLIKYQPNILE